MHLNVFKHCNLSHTSPIFASCDEALNIGLIIPTSYA